MIVTIDGPAGSGKSTAARKLAAKLGIAYLDTGAMYRAIALAAIQKGVPLEREAELVKLAREARVEVDCGPTHTRVTLDGKDVSEAIRSMVVNQATSHVARIPEIRRMLVDKQRAIGQKLGALVTEGRDQGSVVFPDADIKFLLDATIEKRALRRYQELVSDGEEASYELIMENLQHRDGNDCCQWAPLLEEGAAIQIDTTQMTLQAVIERLCEEVRFRTGCNSTP
ncbi:MAG: (d)CMP kinase [Planctomycetota bacterium]